MKKRALIHVENTENVIEFAKFLSESGWEILSANKTEELLKKEDIPVTHENGLVISSSTSADTAKLIQNILFTSNRNEEYAFIDDSKSEANIFIVCLNIYPEANFSYSTKQIEALIHPSNFHTSSIIRNAYINSPNIMIIVDPADYKEAMIQIKTDNISKEFRTKLAAKALNMISAYDGGISNSILLGLNQSYFSNYLTFPFKKLQLLQNGANKQQEGCLYKFPETTGAISGLSVLSENGFDFNTIYDISSVWEQISIFSTVLKDQFSVNATTCDGYEYTTQFTPQVGNVFTIALKMNSILGASYAPNAVESCQKTLSAYDPDTINAAVLGFSSAIDEETANELIKHKIGVVVAPAFTEEAKSLIANSSSIKIVPIAKISISKYQLLLLNGGLLFQTKDDLLFDHWYVKTKLRPEQNICDEIAIGTLISMASRSYSAVLMRNYSIVGISQAAKSSSKAVEYAHSDAKDYVNRNMDEKGFDAIAADLLVCDSPITLTDSIRGLIEHGLKAIVQPGGTDKDEEFINYCNEHNVSMIFTGTSHITY